MDLLAITLYPLRGSSRKIKLDWLKRFVACHPPPLNKIKNTNIKPIQKKTLNKYQCTRPRVILMNFSMQRTVWFVTSFFLFQFYSKCVHVDDGRSCLISLYNVNYFSKFLSNLLAITFFSIWQCFLFLFLPLCS